MTPALRKANLTAHVASSVAWLGAVASFFALSVAALVGADAETVRGAYLAMDLVGGFIIVPLSLTALLTGLVQSLFTRWGLFRYHWVVAKLVLTVGATALLLLHQYTAVEGAASRVSATVPATMPEVGSLGTQLVIDSGVAVLVLLTITILGVYKPWGMTPYGRRREREERGEASGLGPASSGPSLGLKLVVAGVCSVLAAFAVLHIAGGGLGRHGP